MEPTNILDKFVHQAAISTYRVLTQQEDVASLYNAQGGFVSLLFDPFNTEISTNLDLYFGDCIRYFESIEDYEKCQTLVESMSDWNLPDRNGFDCVWPSSINQTLHEPVNSVSKEFNIEFKSDEEDSEPSMEAYDVGDIETQWIDMVWCSDVLLEISTEDIHTHKKLLTNDLQKKALTIWSKIEEKPMPASAWISAEERAALEERSSDDGFSRFLNLLEELNDTDEYNDITAVWDKVHPDDAARLFSNNWHNFYSWYSSLELEQKRLVDSKLDRGEKLHSRELVDFVKDIIDRADLNDFLNVSIINGMLAISCSDIIRLNRFKTLMLGANAEVHEQRRKILGDDTIVHTMVFKMTDIR